jgi:hypothetical protein
MITDTGGEDNDADWNACLSDCCVCDVVDEDGMRESRMMMLMLLMMG